MVSMKILAIYFILSLFTCDSYRILATIPFQGKSHRSVFYKILKALAEKGHEVDLISHDPIQNSPPNLRNVIKLTTETKVSTRDFTSTTSTENKMLWVNSATIEICEQLDRPDMREFVKKLKANATYDLLLNHQLINEQCFNVLGHIMSIPVVLVVTSTLYPDMCAFVDNPLNLALAPSNFVECCENEVMSFWDRLYNVVMTHWTLAAIYKATRVQDDVMKKILGPVPNHRELEKNIDLILSNSHYSYHGVKPKHPAVIEIGGIHITNDTSSFDPKLQKILDGSPNGFIFFSFGTNLRIETLPEHILRKFYKALEKLSPSRIIMRVQEPSLMPKDMPSNVLMYTWLPQQQILRHPNIKAFVTHGGALGTQEAVYFSVPMICVPFFADQISNCELLRKKKVAIKLDISTANQEDYDRAFQKMISDQNYKLTAQKLSILYRDRPLSPSDEAVYWIEYVIRHGRKVLRSPVAHLAWWQIELLDVYAFITVSLLMAIIFVTLSVYKLSTLLSFICTEQMLTNLKDSPTNKKLN